MDFDLSDEQRMVAESATRYVREQCTLERQRDIARSPEGFSRQRWTQFAAMGWLALPVPEEHGGLGGGPVEVALLLEALGHGLVTEPLVDSVVLCAALLAQPQTTARAAALLGALISGDALPTLAHMEAGERSEYEAAVAATATCQGDGWTLCGTKHLVRHGHAASHWLVTARIVGGNQHGPSGGQSDGHANEAGFALFAVDRNAAGVRLQSQRLIDGTCGADLYFDDTPLPASALLLSPAHTGAALEQALDHAVLALCASALGAMEAVMALTADHLKTRVQYGQPLARFQALQHRMAEMFVETEQARAALWRAIAAVQAGEPQERAHAISAAKWLVTRAGLFVTGQGIQLHGGIGVTEEYAVGHHYKALVAFDKRLGEADFHLLRSSPLFKVTTA